MVYPVTSLRLNGGCNYRVHLLNRNTWFPALNGNNINDYDNGYAGNKNGDAIDGVAWGVSSH